MLIYNTFLSLTYKIPDVMTNFNQPLSIDRAVEYVF